MDRIQQIANEVAKRVPQAIVDLNDQILEAITAAQESKREEEAEKQLVITIPLAVKWNLDKNTVELQASVSVKHRNTQEFTLDDPDQIPLIDRDGNPLPEKIAKPLKAIHAAVQAHGASVSFSIPSDKKTIDALKKASDELRGGAE